MIAIFQRKLKRLTFISNSLKHHFYADYDAANNADRTSKGSWPAGVYDVDTIVEVDDEFDGASNGAYGRWFIRFKDFTEEGGTKRTGMGIHAGRKGKTDLAGRDGVNYATQGCIRTTEDALDFLTSQWKDNPLMKLWVVD